MIKNSVIILLLGSVIVLGCALKKKSTNHKPFGICWGQEMSEPVWCNMLGGQTSSVVQVGYREDGVVVWREVLKNGHEYSCMIFEQLNNTY